MNIYEYECIALAIHIIKKQKTLKAKKIKKSFKKMGKSKKKSGANSDILELNFFQEKYNRREDKKDINLEFKCFIKI